ncbi:MAG: hypothetical protein DSY46_02175 [Hydrogenimonas sp.]|nr:MAG: hypothetical protein DSY46_02175 [Hydrogenimonas sp.]
MYISTQSCHTLAWEIQDEVDLYIIVENVKACAEKFGFTPYDSTLISLAVSEISTNALRYAHGGRVSIQPTLNSKGLEVTIKDHGKGIKDLSLVMQDGYSTTIDSLGIGFGAAARLVDEMIFDHNSDDGTTIRLIKYLPVPDNYLDIGVVSFPDTRELLNGDGYLIKKYEGDKVLIAILDGAGHGAKAQEATQQTKNIIAENYKLPLDQILHKCDTFLRKIHSGRGVELGLLRITSTYAEFSGIGHIGVHSNRESHLSFPMQNGRLAWALPKKILMTRYSKPDHFMIILHTDGIVNNNFHTFYDFQATAQSIAVDLFNQYAQSDDDATVIIVKG